MPFAEKPSTTVSKPVSCAAFLASTRFSKTLSSIEEKGILTKRNL